MSTSNGNQRYGVWDSYNDMALSLSPTLGNSSRCVIRGCNGLVDSQSWAQGYRTCMECMEKISGLRKNERSEQNIISAADIGIKQNTGVNTSFVELPMMSKNDAENAQYLDDIGNRKFKRALQNEENRAQREEWINAIPKEWSF